MRVRLRRLGALAIGTLASVLVATTAIGAVAWSPATDLRHHDDGLAFGDADFEGTTVGVAWEEIEDNRLNIGFRVSHNGGSSFSAPVIVERARRPQVEICDGTVNAAFAKRNGPRSWSIQRAVENGGGGFGLTTVVGGAGIRGSADIACSNGRVIVSWLEAETAGARLWMATALLSDGIFEPPVSLGLDSSEFPHGLAVAAAGRHIYAVSGDEDGKLRLRRWTEGAAPNHPLTARGVDIVAPGNQRDMSFAPEIAAQGDTVALAWARCSGTHTRVSTDHGATWGAVQHVVRFPCDAIVEGGTGPDGLAIDGDRIALVYSAAAIPNFHASYLVRTKNGFETFRREELGEHQSHGVGFLDGAGGPTLANVFEKNFDVLKFRRQT